MPKNGYVWVYDPKPAKLDIRAKENIKHRALKEIESLSKVKDKISRVEVKAGRVYLYGLVEQFISEGCIILKPLIDGKYLEFPYARITLYDSNGKDCTMDWQRYNNQWVTLDKGTLEECLQKIEQNSEWF